MNLKNLEKVRGLLRTADALGRAMIRVIVPCQWPGCQQPRTQVPGWGCDTHWKWLPTELLRRMVDAHAEENQGRLLRAISDANMWVQRVKSVRQQRGRRSKPRRRPGMAILPRNRVRKAKASAPALPSKKKGRR